MVLWKTGTVIIDIIDYDTKIIIKGNAINSDFFLVVILCKGHYITFLFFAASAIFVPKTGNTKKNYIV